MQRYPLAHVATGNWHGSGLFLKDELGQKRGAGLVGDPVRIHMEYGACGLLWDRPGNNRRHDSRWLLAYLHGWDGLYPCPAQSFCSPHVDRFEMSIKKLITLLSVLLVGAVYTTTYKPASASNTIENLDEKSLQISGWSFLHEIDMDYKKYTALDPSSLIFRNYQDDTGDVVNLTVVYHQNDRWGAHDPVICYESQGWKVSTIDRRQSVFIEGRRIVLNGFTVRKAQHTRLVYYLWFSSRENLVGSRTRQMIDMVLSGLFRGYTESGFIRFSIGFTPEDLDQKSDKLKGFVKAFIEVFKTT